MSSFQTAQAADSGNQTYENGFDDYNIFISKAFLKWEPNEWLTVTAGKFSNPFYTTDLVWDSDINPTGLAESIALHKLFNFGGTETVEGYSKDGKATASRGRRHFALGDLARRRPVHLR